MSSLVLARKYRPQSFEALTGQMHVVKPLSYAITAGRMPQACLFSGTSGIGKTTIARILAKALNCESGMTATPCQTCSACRAIEQGNFVDLIEVDAASKTKVEDTRTLLDNVQYAPTIGRYKIYLIDEVHMLSNHSFNALLKTLEEPPPRVLFLLATTDPQKLPATVLSRCLQFHLKPLTREEIQSTLARILSAEQVPFEPSALALLAEAACGKLRDALSLLDQAIAFSHAQVTSESVSEMLGWTSQKTVHSLVESVVRNDAKALLELSRGVQGEGADLRHLLETLLSMFRWIAVVQQVPEIVPSEGDPEWILARSRELSPEAVQLYYQILLLGLRDWEICPDAATGFEMTLLRLLAFQPAVVSVGGEPPEAGKSPELLRHRGLAQDMSDLPASGEALTLDWDKTVEDLALTGILALLASHCIVKAATQRQIVLQIQPKYAMYSNPVLKQELETALKKHLKSNIVLMIEVGEFSKETPAIKRNRVLSAEHQAKVSAIQGDETVQYLAKTFGVELDPDLIEKEP